MSASSHKASKASPFTVLLRDLPTHRRMEVDSAFAARTLVGLPMRDALEAPADDPDAGRAGAELDVYADGAHVFVAGDVEGSVTVACSRCVAPVHVPFSEKLRVTFVPRDEISLDDAEAGSDTDKHKHKDKDKDAEVELSEDELDVFPYEGEAIDLEPLLREQLILAVPFAPLCREDCKGLCPQCGIDRNFATCNCEGPLDPRFAALKGLKLSS